MRISTKRTGGFPMESEEYFIDEDTGKEYSRIIGGVAWPGKEPGFAVVVGEERSADREKRCDVLWERESPDTTELIKHCTMAKASCRVQAFYGDIHNFPLMDTFRKSNAGFYIVEAPFLKDPDGFSAYLLKIREKTNLYRKALYFGKESKLPSTLVSITNQSIPSSTREGIVKYPCIAALGFVLTAMDVFDHGDEDRKVAALNEAWIEELYHNQL